MSVKKQAYEGRIVAIGIGNAGCNAIRHFALVAPKGVRLIAVDTDAQSIEISRYGRVESLLIGRSILNGRGANGKPIDGLMAASADSDMLKSAIG
ncbi:MAG: hypothetical protein ACREBW_01865, partial [Candidatus Micrarchaeaceae archaeon]